MAAAAGGNIIVCGMSTGRISFRETHSFKEIRSIDLADHGAVRSLWFSEGKQTCKP